MDKSKAMEIVEKLKTENQIAKVVRVGDEYYVLKPITINDFFVYRQKESLTQNDEIDLVISHIVEDGEAVRTAPAGLYERLKDMLFEISGFTNNVSVVYDPTITKNIRDISLITEEIAQKQPTAKVITINRIPFVVLPITTSEYMEYKSNTDKIVSMTDGDAFKKAYELDKNLVMSHVIYPEELPDEAGYLEVLFQMLWQISGFTQDVEVIEA